MTEDIRDFIQSLQANTGTVLLNEFTFYLLNIRVHFQALFDNTDVSSFKIN
jgi:hypothetical protein